MVIPSRGREEALERCLENLLLQDLAPHTYEIIVVDDDQGDATRQVVAAVKARSPVLISYERGAHRGVGAARNLGVNLALAPLVVLIGNDILANPEFLSQHIKFHDYFSDEFVAVLGQTKLHPQVLASPFMRLWGDLPYWELVGQIEVPNTYFFTGNISFKKAFFLKHGLFDEGFRRIGWEDVEVGLRLAQHGMKIMYNSKALAYHNHTYTLAEACHQQLDHGYNFGLLADKLRQQGLTQVIPGLAEKYGMMCASVTWKGFFQNNH